MEMSRFLEKEMTGKGSPGRDNAERLLGSEKSGASLGTASGGQQHQEENIERQIGRDPWVP